MRTIKFRVWDGKELKSLEGYASFDDGRFEMDNGSKDDIIEQYTGLLDRNGVEIYENDIIKFPYETGGDEAEPPEQMCHLKQVTFYKGSFGTDRGHWCEMEAEYDLSQVEVVGNIHTTPSLLGESGGDK